MPRATLQLHLRQPCAESWEAMTPAGAGRHCAACQQVVVDFTRRTDAELLAYIRQAAGQPTCGRLRPDQLNRTLHPAAPVSRWRAWRASALALGGVLSAGQAGAQSRPDHAGPPMPAMTTAVPTELSYLADVPPIPGDIRAPVAPAGKVVLRGTVRDADNCQVLPGVAVLLEGTTTGTSTNADGQFELAVDQAGPLALRAAFIGYTTTRQLVADPGRPLELALLADVKGGLGFTIVPPAPWHPRSLYYWGNYWLTRLFHR